MHKVIIHKYGMVIQNLLSHKFDRIGYCIILTFHLTISYFSIFNLIFHN